VPTRQTKHYLFCGVVFPPNCMLGDQSQR